MIKKMFVDDISTPELFPLVSMLHINIIFDTESFFTSYRAHSNQ